MYSFFILIQYTGILVLIIEIIYIFRQKSSRLQSLMLLVTASTLINFVGYLFEMRATTQEMALQAVKFIYFGKPYIVLGIFLFILKYYKVDCPKWIRYLLISFHIGLTFAVLECEKQQLYYSSISYTQEGYFPHLVLGKGILYKIFSVLIVIYLTVILLLGILNYRKTTDSAEHKRILCLSGAAVVSSSGLIIYFSGVTRGYDSTLPAYVISTILLFVSMLRYNLLDTMELVRESIMDDFTDGLVVLDTDQKLIYTNAVVQKIYPDIITEKSDAVLNELMEQSRLHKHFSKDNKYYRLRERALVHSGKTYGKMYVVADITETHQYTIELEQQKAIAEQANKAKSDFLAKMSHEIRTPINSVLGMNEMILRECGEEPIRKYAQDIKSSASALLSIINEILDLSKIESGKLEILPIEYELSSLLNDSIHMIYARLKNKGLQLDVKVQEDLPDRLFGDDVRLRQILTNLLTNAVKYTPTGVVTFSVSGRVQEQKVILRCEVADTGIGIKKEDLPRLSEAFERFDESRNRSIEGTGLGMSIVIDLLHLMGSRLQVESTYGEGSRFWFDLEQDIIDSKPIGNFEKDAFRLEQEQKYQALFTAPEARILLVDDNDVNRSVFCQLLKQTKVQITDVASGQMCLEMLQKCPFDIIFLDYMMPEMDGVETLHRIQSMEDNLSKDIPVIMLTANAVKGARESYLAEGFCDFLSKPIVPEKLEKILKQYLPQDLVCETPAEETAPSPQAETELLPELEEFDFQYARLHLREDALIRQTMWQIYLSMDGEIACLERLAEEIRSQNPDAIPQYRIHVHTLKSTSATVGALLLSKLARLSEVAAIEGKTDKLLTLHPILIEEMHKHADRLRTLQSEEPEKPLAQLNDIRPLLQKLADALEELEYDTADEISGQLGAYTYDTAIQPQMDVLQKQILNLEAQAAIETVRAIQNSE